LDPNLYVNLNGPAEALKGSCMETEFPAPPASTGTGGGFFDLIYQSIPEAENQAAKFTHRVRFLQARVNEVNYIIGIFNQAITQLSNFLNGPAAALIQERINFSGEELPYQVIYGWQGDPPPNNPAGVGLWHIVKVEARIPERCDNACDPSQTQPQGWPRMRSYKRNLGTQRCYELVDTDGVVKTRVIRYDENRPSNPLFFPSGIRIWDFRSHPDRSVGNTAANLDSTCPPMPGAAYQGAFIVNRPGWSAANPSDTAACWNRVDTLLLNYGVASETCAKYYLHGGAREGFDFRFVPCLPF
jgi:hypothetical protein